MAEAMAKAEGIAACVARGRGSRLGRAVVLVVGGFVDMGAVGSPPLAPGSARLGSLCAQRAHGTHSKSTLTDVGACVVKIG